MMDKRTLKKWYRQINDAMFNGELPEIEVFTFKDPVTAGQAFDVGPIHGACWPHHGHICVAVNVNQSRRDCWVTLAHEAFHVYQIDNGKSAGPWHGSDFMKLCRKAMEVFNYG